MNWSTIGKSFVDGAGRIISLTNALGQKVKYEVDALNRTTKVTDPVQGTTQFAYDANNNLLSVTDARSKAIQYVYDNMDRVVTRKDPLLNETTYEYNEAGLIETLTDRKGQETAYEYDELNRLTLVTYDDASTTSYTYDDGNRVTEIDDSVAGTITYDYDDLDRLLSETTAQGTVSYTYDAAGRRATMTAGNQSQVSYTHDNADRLTQITQGSATVTYAYDNADRVTSVTKPNGVVTEYAYDAASRLTGIVYKKSGVTLGNLSYEYDAIGRRVKMGGSLAQVNLPTALTTTAYNNANHQTTFGSNTLTYDLNGNLTADGAKTYTWNARNQLTAISGGGVSASFAYDAAGRRKSKTLSSTTTSFLYDGANVVQEQVSGSASANLLTGGIDRFFSRTDSSGTTTPLVDGLGSVIGLTDASGAIQTQYSYEPFGKSSTSGTTSSNTQKYTGREDDGTGLFYYRARYYSPELQRFISEDPIGLAGGDINLFVYVGNDPISFTDPGGLKPNSMGMASGSDPYLNDPNRKPPGWDPSWPTGVDNRGPYSEDPSTGRRYYPHNEDNGHWDHYDYDDDGKPQRHPPDSIKPWPGQKRRFKPNQSQDDPWNKIPRVPIGPTATEMRLWEESYRLQAQMWRDMFVYTVYFGVVYVTRAPIRPPSTAPTPTTGPILVY